MGDGKKSVSVVIIMIIIGFPLGWRFSQDSSSGEGQENTIETRFSDDDEDEDCCCYYYKYKF